MTAALRAGDPISARVGLDGRAYDIVIGRGEIASLGRRIAALRPGCKVAIVTDETVARHHLAATEQSLTAAGVGTAAISVPAGEASKSFGVFERVCDGLIAARIERGDLVVALGGGVVGDLAGFAASVVRRGVDYVQVPTTLLAQVDSSVGGKTAINHPLGKNMIGAFHQPSAVVADTSTLETLPAREYAAGLAEVVKYGAIHDLDFLAWLEDHAVALQRRDAAALAHAIRRSCEIKAEIVAADERDTGARALLNFGHTFGHAIESAAGYGSWLHGEAVAAGMALAARLGLPVSAPGFALDTWLEYMGRDKKNEDGRITLVLLDRLGRGAVVGDTPERELRDFLAAA
jgi:3-dehydroquinate synthase